MAITRRHMIVTGTGGAALLALASCAAPTNRAFSDHAYGYAFLHASDLPLAAALARSMLGDVVARDAALHDAVRGLDRAISGLPPAVRGEVRQLLDLLNFPITRRFAAGVAASWPNATPADVDAFLQRWRASNVSLFRSGYSALHSLINGGWYGQDAAWGATGYPGPPHIA